MNIALPGTALAEQLYRAARAQGYGQKGTQALAAALAAVNKRETPRSG
jgi:3-hydroxyisobutyrate dehydrogenase